MKVSALVAAMLILPAVNPAYAGDPKIRVKLSDDVLSAGDKAKVKVKAAQDGYLLVLRMDTEGRVKVIFPVDPGDNAAIRGGKEIEVRSRGDREAFTVAERAGNGTLVAVRADQPLNFAGYTTGDRWDLSSVAPDSGAKDAEGVLLKIADRMSGGHYDYDAVSYHVDSQVARRSYGNRYYDARYAGWYDPWYFGSAYSAFPYYYRPTFGYSYVRVVRGPSRGRGRH